MFKTVKTPDDCLDRILKIAVILFFAYLVTFLYGYRTLPLHWAIWALFATGLFGVSMIFVYFRKYHAFKKSNIVPIKNTLRDLKELKKLYDETKDEKLQKEMKDCWGKLVGQMKNYVKPENQYIRIITKNYQGLIGTIDDHSDVNHIYFANIKGVYLHEKPDMALDLTTIDYLEGVQGARKFYERAGKKPPRKSWYKKLSSKI